MLLKILKYNLKWIFLQFVSFIVAYSFSLLGLILLTIFITIASALELQSIMTFLDSILSIFTIGLLFLGYALFWYFVIKKEWKKEDFNIKRVILLSLLPNIFLAIYYLYKLSQPSIWPEDKGTPYGGQFLVFFYSLILFPIFLYGLNKWVLIINNRSFEIKRLIFLLFALLFIGVLLIMLTIGIIGLDKFNYLIK